MGLFEFLIEQYFKLMGVFDNIYSGCVQHLDNSIGFGHNWIMQGSIQDAKNSEKFENYIFFEKKQAIEFRKQNARKAGRYIGSRTANLDFFIRKPKILVYNLEDFLELWGESLVLNTDVTQSFININQPTYFIPSKRSIKTLEQYYNRPKDSLGKSIKVWGRRKLSKLYWFRTNYLGLILRGNRI